MWKSHFFESYTYRPYRSLEPFQSDICKKPLQPEPKKTLVGDHIPSYTQIDQEVFPRYKLVMDGQRAHCAAKSAQANNMIEQLLSTNNRLQAQLVDIQRGFQHEMRGHMQRPIVRH